jgi:hypothetical protein
VNKSAAIKLLVGDGWTKADADRALAGLDFGLDPNEAAIWRAASAFAGPELKTRQRLQAAQKGLVTRRTSELELKDQENEFLEGKAKALALENNELAQEKTELVEVNDRLKTDNKALKNLLDSIKLRLAIDVRQLMNYKDSEIRQALAKWYKSSQG